MIRKKARTNLNYCLECRRETDFVSLCQAASLFSVDAANLFQFIKTHNSHFEPDANGMIFVCLVSLLGALKTKTSFSQIKMLDE